MDESVKRTLTSIGKEEYFKHVLEKLTLGAELEENEKTFILSSAILFLNYYKNDNKYTSYADFAYYLILKYSIATKDYRPLYDFSISFGFYPISQEILDLDLLEQHSLKYCFDEIKLQKFKHKDKYTETFEQRSEVIKLLDDQSKEKSFLAPTSYGKSSLIVDYIKKLGFGEHKIVIVVPTKSLLAQTYQMIRDAQLGMKILIHDEMYTNEKSFVAIFTQERALRLMRKGVHYSVLFIDEAHNIFKNDPRSILLSRLLSKNASKNPEQEVVYLSPLVTEVSNLRLSTSQNIRDFRIRFNVKEPEIFEYKLNGEVVRYNRFVNQFYSIGNSSGIFDYIRYNSKAKNFLYNYRPVKIELLAKELVSVLPEIEMNQELLQLQETLKREVHKDFFGVEYLKYGVVYIHGKIPDIIKEYIESKYKAIQEIKYIIANSVILEGMNLPIDNLFIMNTRSLEGNELINLIGRVNRLNYVFNNDQNNLDKLLPYVHFVNSEEYNRQNSQMSNKINLLRSRIFEDDVQNPTLESFDIEKIKGTPEHKENQRQKAEKILANEELLNTVPRNNEDRLKQYLIESGINLFYNNIEEIIPELLERISTIELGENVEWTSMRMLDKIDNLFIADLSEEAISDYTIKRLQYEATRNYYENHIRISQKKSLNENIVAQVEFFKEKAASPNSKLYVGSSYGEEPLNTDNYANARNKVYIDLFGKSEEVLVNLAVVKLKMEDDFVSFKLNKLIVMLHDYNLISDDDYNLYVYGTTDTKKIALTKYGLNIGLVSKLQDDAQMDNLYFDQYNNLKYKDSFNSYLNSLSDFHRFEISRFIS